MSDYMPQAGIARVPRGELRRCRRAPPAPGVNPGIAASPRISAPPPTSPFPPCAFPSRLNFVSERRPQLLHLPRLRRAIRRLDDVDHVAGVLGRGNGRL